MQVASGLPFQVSRSEVFEVLPGDYHGDRYQEYPRDRHEGSMSFDDSIVLRRVRVDRAGHCEIGQTVTGHSQRVMTWLFE